MKLPISLAILAACSLDVHSWSQNPEPKRIQPKTRLFSTI